jgi:signal transduction histidine kinase
VTSRQNGYSDGNAGYPRPRWLVNLLAVGILILLILAYFFWQIRYAQNTFSKHVRDHAGMLAGVIRLNARNTLLAQKSIEEIIEIFLSDSARFIDYLDAVEPFTVDELQAYSLETGLAGIRIIRPGGQPTEGPAGWLPATAVVDLKRHSLGHFQAGALYYLVQPRVEEPGVIIVGYTARRIERLREETGLPRLLKELSLLPGIDYVRVQSAVGLKSSDKEAFGVELINRDGQQFARARLLMDDGRLLVVGVEAVHFFKRLRQLWTEFFLFSVLIALSGALVSWILYRYQSTYLERVHRLESRLAREREDAALGRASATIAHEIRNPLNAISMGLQRLQMEAEELSEPHRELVGNLLQAVSRTDGIVTGLKRYAQPLQPRRENVDMAALVKAIVDPYRQVCERTGIRLSFQPRFRGTVSADAQLLSQAIENLVKNAIEAQPWGGFIDIELYRDRGAMVICVENGGFSLDPGETSRMPEPYFTTKVNGSGLGLALVTRIMRAHGGRVNIRVPREKVLRIELTLPMETSS